MGHLNVNKSMYESIKNGLQEQLSNPSLEQDKEIAGWFLGTRGENLNFAVESLTNVLTKMMDARKNIFPNDSNYITDEIKNTDEYKNSIELVNKYTGNIVDLLNTYSLPMYSLRYQAHMTWDVTLPSVLGYFAGILQNQNNVTPQASPLTTILEIMASNDIAQMEGFEVRALDNNEDDGNIYAWTHISCDGSVANIESMWAARELKFFPLGIHYALGKGEYLELLADKLTLPSGKLYIDASAWELLNLKMDYILGLPQIIFKLLKEKDKELTLSEVWEDLTKLYSLNAKGMQFFFSEYLDKNNIKMPVVIVPSTKHYSWVKGASILGMGNGRSGLSEKDLTDGSIIGSEGLINVYVDPEGKMKLPLLNSILNTCRESKKPVIMVVGVMGTTEEGAVDTLEEIISMREDFRKDTNNPFEYSIHADAAWGGYFLSCIRNKFEMVEFPFPLADSRNAVADGKFDNNDSWFRESVYKSMSSICKCDSVTTDPHKMGYMPYPAGSLTYRNEKITNLLTFSAPYISSGNSNNTINTKNIGESGIEGSKPGAAAVSVYLSHLVIRPDKRGYGKIVNQSMLNTKLFYLYVYTMEQPQDKFEVVMFDEYKGSLDKKAVKDVLYNQSHSIDNITGSVEVKDTLRSIAGDQNIVDYIFIDKNNRSFERIQQINNAIFNKLSLEPGMTLKGDEIFVSMTTFNRSDYGNEFMDSLAKRLGISDPENIDGIPCIRSVIMDPWAIYTSKEGTPYNFFMETYIPKLSDVVNEICSISMD